jgi:cobalt-zinc-cadmium efflux system protein
MHRHDHSSTAGDNLRFAFLLNALFTAVEIVGGLWTNSVAILSDAVHDGGDCLSLGAAWYLQRLSERDPDETFSYGYRRLSSLGALLTSVVLIAGLSFVVWEAVERLRDPREVRAGGVIGIALVGILFNGAAVFRLRGGTSLSERVASWHLLEDVLGWIAVLIGGGVMSIWDAPIVDPLLALLIAAVILWNVLKNLKRVGLVFLQASPAGFDPARFDDDVRKFPGVKATHHTHTWTLDGQRHVLSTHVVLAAGSPRETVVDVKRRIYSLLRDQHFEHITIETEIEGEQCSLDDPICAVHAD